MKLYDCNSPIWYNDSMLKIAGKREVRNMRLKTEEVSPILVKDEKVKEIFRWA